MSNYEKYLNKARNDYNESAFSNDSNIMRLKAQLKRVKTKVIDNPTFIKLSLMFARKEDPKDLKPEEINAVKKVIKDEGYNYANDPYNYQMSIDPGSVLGQ